jgi:hypothetical protein
MYCPRCGHQQPSEQFRFCSRCGFQLGAIKEMIASDEASSEGSLEPGAQLLRLRQTDINIGAGVMLIGAIKAAVATSILAVPFGEAIIMGLLVLSMGFAIVLLLSQLSPRQRGLTLGATLMFVGSLVAGIFTGPFGWVGIALIASIVIPLILFWCRLSGVFLKSFFDREGPAGKERFKAPEGQPQLIQPSPFAGLYRPPDRASDTDPKLSLKVPGAERPASVTERTTELFEAGDKKGSSLIED